MSGKTLPGISAPSEPPSVICHVDMDCFYASCERLQEPSLKNKPVIVGMGYERGTSDGAVATASYEARNFGIESAQPISQALQLLPSADETDSVDSDVGYYRPARLGVYERIAAEVKDILHDCADVVREQSIDEAYLDLTEQTTWEYGTLYDRPLAEGYARYIKQRIQREVGVPASIGIAPTMSAAKVASDYHKPDGLVCVEPGDVKDFFAPLSIDEIHGIGPVTAAELETVDIETGIELANADRDTVAEILGDRGAELQARAQGIDTRTVTPRGRPKSLSRESALTDITDDSGKHQEVIAALATAVAERARQCDALYRTIGIKIVEPPFEISTRETSLSGPIDDPTVVNSVARDLLAEFEMIKIRKLGVRVSNLSFTQSEQTQLDGWQSGHSPPSKQDPQAQAAATRLDTQTTLCEFQ